MALPGIPTANTSFTTIGTPTVTLTVTTDLGCVVPLTRELNIAVIPCCDSDNGIIALSNPIEPLCNGGSSGSIDLNITSTPPLTTINWEDGATGANRNSLSAGDYNVTITNDATCDVEIPIILGEPNPIIPTLTITEPTCEPASNGAITISATGGTVANNSYEFDFNDGNGFSTTNTLTGLFVGDYDNIRVRDDNNCIVPIDTFLAVPAGFNPITASLNITPPTCDEAMNGAITVTAIGNGLLLYDFNNGIDPSTDNILPNLGIGPQSITIQDLDGCLLPLDTTIVASAIPPIEASVQINPTSCEAAANGCLLYTSPSPRDATLSRMPSSA